MYLVMIRHNLDDIPLRLFNHHGQAIAFAQQVWPNAGGPEMDLMGIDANTPASVAIAEFSPSGHMIKFDIVKKFEVQ